MSESLWRCGVSPDEYTKARSKLVDAIVTEAFAWHGYHQDDRDHMGERDRALFDAVTVLYDLNQQLLEARGETIP